jgi:hypothetical protein
MRQKAKEKGGNISSNKSKRNSLAGRKEASFAGRRQKSSREASGDGDDQKFRFSAKRKRSAGASVAAGYQDAPESKRSRLKETKPRHPALGRTSSFVHPRQRMDRVDGLRQKKAGPANDKGGRRLPEVEDAGRFLHWLFWGLRFRVHRSFQLSTAITGAFEICII